MKTFRFILNGERKELNAPNKWKAIRTILNTFPEVKDLDYRKLNIIEL